MRARGVAAQAETRAPRLGPLDDSWSPPSPPAQPDVVVRAARAVLRERRVAPGVGEWLVRLLLRVEADPQEGWAAKLRRLDAYLHPPIPYDAAAPGRPASPPAVERPFSAAAVDALAGRVPTPTPLDRARFLNATAQPTPTARRRLAFATTAPATASTRSTAPTAPTAPTARPPRRRPAAPPSR